MRPTQGKALVRDITVAMAGLAGGLFSGAALALAVWHLV
jgi:hypothetical protein